MSDWANLIRQLRLNEQLHRKHSLNPMHFLIYSPVPWAQGNIERMLSIALQLRGHGVDEIICGGDFPACGMEHSNAARPNCSDCYANALNWFDIWGLRCESTSVFRDHNDLEIVREMVRRLHLERYVDMNFHDVSGLEFVGYPLGLRIYQKTHWYFSGNFTNSNAVLDQLTKCAESYILGIEVAQRILQSKKYDAIIVANGKTIEGSPIIDVALKKRIRVITWEEIIMFDNQTPVIEFNQNGVWESLKNHVLNREQKHEIEQYFKQWRVSEKTSWVKDPIIAPDIIIRTLGLRNSSYKVALFPNILLDSSIIGMNTAFDDIFDWIYSCVDYAIINPDIDLIIRSHPAEKETFHFLSSQIVVVDEIRKRYGQIPPNLFLIGSDSNISSYGLLEFVDVPITYTGTLALEAPLNDRLCVVAGKTHFRNKGFTIDLETKEEMYALFDSRKSIRRPTECEKELALRYAYLFKKRMIAKLDFYDNKSVSFDIKSLQILEEGGHIFWDNLCDSIINNYAFIDLDIKDRTPIDLNTASLTNISAKE